MLQYPLEATTAKNIKKFTYNMYMDIGINMLKYNHDSSATLRVLSSVVETSQDVLEDLKYKPRFNMAGFDFIGIDRFNAFALGKIPNADIERIDGAVYSDIIKGYSKFTGLSYSLEQVNDADDFVRHSLPCDAFFGEQTYADGYQLITLSPNVKTMVDLKVKNSIITIRPFSGFQVINMLDAKKTTILIEGVSPTGMPIKETIEVDAEVDYKSVYEYGFITGMIATGSVASVTVILYPFINGEFERWNNDIVDRETGETYPATVSVDRYNKKLLFNIINDTKTTYPIQNEAYKSVDMDIPPDETIWTYFIDLPNTLLYAITSAKKLYCFPLIIPSVSPPNLDAIKTDYQSVRIEYYDDSINREYSFYIFPSHKNNGIESLNIVINGEIYRQDLLLDLFRQNIESNRFVISYDELFGNGTTALVEFTSYGDGEANQPVFLHNTPLTPLYVKDLTSVQAFADPEEEHLDKGLTSNRIEYKQYVEGDMGIDENCILIKLSSRANILVNGYKIINVFPTFTYSELDDIIITSDTITHLRGI